MYRASIPHPHKAGPREGVCSVTAVLQPSWEEGRPGLAEVSPCGSKTALTEDRLYKGAVHVGEEWNQQQHSSILVSVTEPCGMAALLLRRLLH